MTIAKMDNNKAFPLDIETVKRYGTTRWQDDFFWPVSDHEYIGLTNDIEEIWRASVVHEQKNIVSILLHARGLPVDLQYFLHAVWVIDRLQKKGFVPQCFEGAPWFYRCALSHSGHETGSDKRFFIQQTIHQRLSYRVITGIKKRIRELQCNSLKKFFSSLGNGRGVCVFGTPLHIVREYIRAYPRWVSITYASDWVGDMKHDALHPLLVNALKRISEEFFDAVGVCATKHSIPLTQEVRQKTYTLIEEHIFNSARVIASVRAQERVRDIKHFIVPNVRASLPLAIALVVKEQGGKVTSFTHGAHVGLFQSPTMAMSEFALSDEFVMFSDGSRPLFEKIYAAKKPPFLHMVALRSTTHSPFLFWKKRMERKPLPKQIKTIMMIGFPYSPWRKAHPGAGAFWAIRLDFELRIMKAFSALGYTILYKVHPDREKEVEGIFEKYATVVKGDMKEFLDIPDAFFFGISRSTALAFALCTTKPIAVCISTTERPYAFPEALERLEKRCDIVHTWFDERNRIQFYTHNLRTIFANRQKWSNMEFMNEYLLPKRV